MSKSSISVGTQGWADRINGAWQKAATAYIDIGNMLIECKKTVLHGDWTALLGKLDFDKRTAQRLMEIARDERLSNPSHATLLPKHWTTLYELTRLSDEELVAALSSGATKREEVKRLHAAKPTVTDAEYQNITESPKGEAVSAEGGSERVPSEIAITDVATPQDDREGGGSVVTWPDPERLDPFKVEDFGSSVTADRAECDTPQAVASPFKQYRRKQIAELRPYVPGEPRGAISISQPDQDAGSPKEGDMIARNPKNHADQWLVSAQYFADNFAAEGETPQAAERPFRADESTVTLVLKTPAYRLAYGLALAMRASKEMTPEEAVGEWPPEMPMSIDDLHQLNNWLIHFEEATGNDAALRESIEG